MTLKPSRMSIATPNKLQSIYTQNWSHGTGLDSMLAGKHKNTEMLANGKTAGDSSSSREGASALGVRRLQIHLGAVSKIPLIHPRAGYSDPSAPL